MLEAKVSHHTRAETTSMNKHQKESPQRDSVFWNAENRVDTMRVDCEHDSTSCRRIAFPGGLKIEFEVEQGMGRGMRQERRDGHIRTFGACQRGHGETGVSKEAGYVNYQRMKR
jgi:hypothetical protein